MMELIIQLTKFIYKRKKYWLIPLIVALLFFGFLLISFEGTFFTPFIYIMF